MERDRWLVFYKSLANDFLRHSLLCSNFVISFALLSPTLRALLTDLPCEFPDMGAHLTFERAELTVDQTAQARCLSIPVAGGQLQPCLL